MSRRRLFALLLAAPLFAYLVYPVGRLLVASLIAPVRPSVAARMGWEINNLPFAAPLRVAFSDSIHQEAVAGTLILSLATVLAGAGWGLSLALLWHRREFPGRRFFQVLGYAPLLMPPLVGTLAFYRLLGPAGAAWNFFGTEPWSPFTQVLIVHAYSFGFYTYVYCGAALDGADPSREEAARGLGAGRWGVFRAAIWPVLRGPLLAAAFITYMAAAASFSAPYFLDNSGRYLTVAIASAPDTQVRAALSAVLAVIALAALPAFLWLQPETDLAAGLRGTARPHLPPARGTGLSVRLLLSVIAGLLLIAPPAMVLASAFDGVGGSLGFSRLGAESWQALGRSLLYGGAAAGVAVLFALGAALILRRAGRWAGAPVEFGVMLALALPGSALALSLLTSFNRASWLTIGIPLGGTAALLVLTYILRILPLAVRPVRAALQAVGQDLEPAAANLGVGPLGVLWRVTLPLLMPSLIAAGLICFVTAAGEFVASVLLYGPRTIPVSVRIEQLHRSDATAAYTLALLLMLLTAVAVAVSRLLAARRR